MVGTGIINKMLKSIAQLVAIIFVILFLFKISNKSSITDIKYVSIGGQKIQVELAVTVAERTQGLSGRKSLDEGTGLLFIFEKSGLYPFWMKDMNFPIDIIWLAPSDGDDQDLKIVYIKHNATPSSYPETFGPDKDAQYILEVVSGFSEKNNLKVGDTVILNY